MKLNITFVLLFLFSNSYLWAQPTNASCNTAIEITDPTDYCSSSGEFGNTNAGPGNPIVGTPPCWNGSNNDVWFRFTAEAVAASITVSGFANGNMIGGSLIQPQVALYEDDGCNTFPQLACESDDVNDGAVSAIRKDLTIGQSYLIRVDGRGNFQGTFTLCILNFNPPVEPGQDCPTASVLCNKDPFVVASVSGGGNDVNEFGSLPDCNGSFQESESTWFKWTCETSGNFTFVLTPIIPDDDIDWALYELPNGLDDCTNKVPLRCAFNSPSNNDGSTDYCGDLTGLSTAATGLGEDPNCTQNLEDGFVSEVNLIAGRSYILGVNNFTPSGVGFEIEFGGSATFQGPELEFVIDPLVGLRCDTFFTVTDASFIDPAIGNITSWDWNFGERAIPQTASGNMPHQVTYESFGKKFISLTVETDQGCRSTEILELFAEPCCDDLQDIGVDVVDQVDLVCATVNDGSIEVAGFDGNPEYQYSLDGSSFNLNPFFGNLAAGTYQVNVQDIKGCTDSIDVVITSPPPIIVDAGPDQSIELCFDSQLNGSYTPEDVNDQIIWTAQDTMDNNSLSCLDCLDPIAVAPGQTTYVLTVVDDVGCSASDEVTIFVEEDYPIYGPNIFTPNGDSRNDMFTLYGGPAAKIIREFYIYDRWGEQVFFTEDIPLNDPSVGWNGNFKVTNDLYSQVFAWYAKIEFCDSEVFEFAGTVTLVKG